MKKTDFIAQAAVYAGLSKKDTEYIVDAVFCCLSDILEKGEKVYIPSFGTFDIKQRAARKVKIPSTGEYIDVPASKVPVFKPAKLLKEKLNP